MLRTRLRDIGDDDVLDVISDLCWMTQQPEGPYQRYSLREFLHYLVTQYRKCISMQYIPGDSVLGQRLEQLQNHAFYEVCKELKGGASLEPFDRNTLISFLKKHFPPAKKLPKKTGVQRMDDDVKRRRNNRR